VAARHNASVSLLSVIDVDRLARVGPVPVGANHHARQLREDRARQSRQNAADAIDRFVAAAELRKVPVRVLRDEGDPFTSLARAWRTHDLCVLGLRGWFDHVVVAEPEGALLRLITQGVRPILALPEVPHRIGKVLIAYNGSMESAKAMKRFCQMRLWPDARVEIAMVGGEDVTPLLNDAADYVSDHGFAVSTARLSGLPERALNEHASAIEADLIVLGSGFRSALLGKVFGSTTLSMVKTSERPLLLSH
jgi:nucleotide-binding universal stress UspA family protein